MKYDVLTIFDICADLVMDLGDTVPEFGQKEKYVESSTIDMGGSTCIFACQCAKLGLNTTGAGVAGDDIFGRLVTDTLSKCGVDISNITTDGDIKTGLGVHLARKGDRSILTYSGSIGAVTAKHITDELLKSARHLHIGSYYLLDGVREELPDILCRAKSFGLTVSLDTNWDPAEKWRLPDKITSNTDIIFPNENEVLLLTGCADINAAIKVLSEKIPVVAVKLGADGGIVENNGKRIKLPAPDVNVADTIGAGDSFDAGFIYAYLHGFTIEDCLRSGLYCGSASTEKAGGIASQATANDLNGLNDLSDYLKL